MKTVFITGAAGFIGSSLALRVLADEPEPRLVGLDNMNDYYDVRIKEARLARLKTYPNFIFVQGNLADKALLDSIFEQYAPQVVVNLAAQAGVRYSITNPDAYIESNLIGFYNVLEACRRHPVEHLVYASSSSVYGGNKKVPFSTDDPVDTPVSLYAATKKSNELMAHAYAKLYDIPSTGLRFFTVYGPAGRPDMAYFGFTDKLIKGETIQIFNYGNCQRDFTYIDDIVEGVTRVMRRPPEKKTGEDGLPLPPYAVYNIGNSKPENLLDFVTILQEELVRAKVLPADYDFEAHKRLVPMQPGDVPVTYADTNALERDFGFRPATPLREGLRTVRWPGRFELLRREPIFIVDGGHNPQCMASLAENLKTYLAGRPITALTGVMADKDYSDMYRIVAPYISRYVTVTPDNPRALRAEALAETLRVYGKPVIACPTVAEGVAEALRQTGSGEAVVAFGSLYMVGDIRAAVLTEN